MAINNLTTLNIIQIQIFSQYSSFTLGFIFLIGGTIGGVLNILIFLTIDQYKRNPCSQYMLAGSIFDLLFLFIGLITRTFSQGFSMDFTLMNPIWCKMRSSLLDIISNCTLTCVCLQSMDVFLITSRSATMRQRSNIKNARYLLISFVFVWICHEIPSFIYQNLIFNNGIPSCTKTNVIYVSYHTYGATLIFSIFIPIIVISLFTYYIYRHLHSMVLREQYFLTVVGRQMTRMSLFQIGTVLLFQLPYGTSTAYFTATANLNKNSERQFQDKLTQTFFSVYVYGLYSVREQ